MDVVGHVGVRVDVDVVRERRVGERAVGGRRGRHGGYRKGHEENDLVKKRGRRTSDIVTCARSGRGIHRKTSNTAVYQIQRLRQHRSVRATPRAQNKHTHEYAYAPTHTRERAPTNATSTREHTNKPHRIHPARETAGDRWTRHQEIPFRVSRRMLEGRTVRKRLWYGPRPSSCRVMQLIIPASMTKNISKMTDD